MKSHGPPQLRGKRGNNDRKNPSRKRNDDYDHKFHTKVALQNRRHTRHFFRGQGLDMCGIQERGIFIGCLLGFV